jgi:hypothetical protein
VLGRVLRVVSENAWEAILRDMEIMTELEGLLAKENRLQVDDMQHA